MQSSYANIRRRPRSNYGAWLINREIVPLAKCDAAFITGL